MGQRIDVVYTRKLEVEDATAVAKLGYKALHETGLFGVDYDESHFYTHIKRGLVSPFWQGSIGLFHNETIVGFAFVNVNQLPWAPKRNVATLQYFYIEPTYQTNENMVRLFDNIENLMKDKQIQSLRISNRNIDDNSLLNLGFNIEEKIYTKDYEL